ncbi:MAG: hypothetical protein MHM6MM_001637 [Cercozoa sp. M6MM]
MAEAEESLDLADLKRIFDACDTDKSGAIDAQELHNALIALGVSSTFVQCKQMIDSIDVDKSGTVDLEEFMTLIRSRQGGVSREEELQQAFACFDRAGDGTIGLAEVRHVLGTIGEKNLTDDEIDAMLKHAGAVGGRLDFEQFCKLANGIPISEVEQREVDAQILKKVASGVKVRPASETPPESEEAGVSRTSSGSASESQSESDFGG